MMKNFKIITFGLIFCSCSSTEPERNRNTNSLDREKRNDSGKAKELSQPNSNTGKKVSLTLKDGIETVRSKLKQGVDPNYLGDKKDTLSIEFYARKNSDTDTDHTLKVAVLLAFGAKVKLEDFEGNSAYNTWKQNKLVGKKFATTICNLVLKEKDISKLDPDFIAFAEELGVESTLISELQHQLNYHTRLSREYEEKIILKLKDGTEIPYTFTRNCYWAAPPNLEEYFEVLKEISEGDTSNINAILSKDCPETPLSRTNAKTCRYLLEKGADPNFLGNSSKQIFLPLQQTALYNSDDDIGGYLLGKIWHYTRKTTQLLAFGAKVKLKDFEGNSAYDTWKKNNQVGKEFATSVCRLLLIELDISDLDPDFILFANELGVEAELISKVESKVYEDTFFVRKLKKKFNY